MKKLSITVIITLICALFSGCKDWKKYADKAGNPVAEIITSMGTIVIELDLKTAPVTVENFIGLAEGTREWINPIDGKPVKKPFYNGLIFYKVISDFMIMSGCPLNSGAGGPGYTFADETMDNSNLVRLSGRIDTEEKADFIYKEVILPYMKVSNSKNRRKDPELLKIISECSESRSVKPIMRYPVEYYLSRTGRKEAVKMGGAVKARVVYGSVCMANNGPGTNGSRFFILTGRNGAPWLDGKHTVFARVIDGMDVAAKIQEVDKYSDGRPVKDIVIKEIKVYKNI